MEADAPGLWRNQHHSRIIQSDNGSLQKRFYFSEATDIWEPRYISKSSGLPRPHAWFWCNDWMFFGSFLPQQRHNNQSLEPTDSWEIISKRQILNQTGTPSPELCLTSLDDNLSIQETVSSNFIDQILRGAWLEPVFGLGSGQHAARCRPSAQAPTGACSHVH